MNDRKVVVTGLGAVAPNGIGLENFWHGISEGISGASMLERFDTEEYPTKFAATIDNFETEEYFDRREARRLDIFVQYGIVAAEEALENAGYESDSEDPGYDPHRVGVIIGSGIGGLTTIEEQHEQLLERGPGRVSPYLIPKLIINMVSGQVAIRNNCQGPNQSVVTACATGAHAIGEAAKIIQRGEADVMLAGGAEQGTTPLGFAGFCSIKALSTRNEDPQAASRPFDKNRDGFVMGEGAGVMVLEDREHAERRGAPIHATLKGFGQTADAFHITQPREDGSGAMNCMRRALEDGGLEREDVDYINAHGTSTPLNDKTETLAIRKLFQEHADQLKVSSTKSTTGHLLGAAGGVEAVATVLALENGVLPPTINYETPDPECDLDYVPNEKQEIPIETAMSNAFGFGGQNATLVFQRA